MIDKGACVRTGAIGIKLHIPMFMVDGDHSLKTLFLNYFNTIFDPKQRTKRTRQKGSWRGDDVIVVPSGNYTLYGFNYFKTHGITALTDQTAVILNGV